MGRIGLLILCSCLCSAQMLKTIVNDKVASGGGGSSITILQSAKNAPGTNTNVKAFGSAVTPGSSLFAVISSDGSAMTITGCSDGVNGAWTHLPSAPSVGVVATWIVDVYYFKNTGAGTPTVTCAGLTTVGLIIFELGGASATAPIDGTPYTGTTDTQGPITTATDNELLVVAGIHGNSFNACDGGYTLLQSANFNTQSDVQAVTAGAAGSYTAGPNCSFQNFFTAYIFFAVKS